ncbi:Protein Dispatched-like 1 [Manis pentadactyla]|nr:Protein Dispatched-like 1 [Manis pentadactyla]
MILHCDESTRYSFPKKLVHFLGEEKPACCFHRIPEPLLVDRTHGEMIPHEGPGSPTEIKCDFPFIRLKSEPARQ